MPAVGADGRLQVVRFVRQQVDRAGTRSTTRVLIPPQRTPTKPRPRAGRAAAASWTELGVPRRIRQPTRSRPAHARASVPSPPDGPEERNGCVMALNAFRSSSRRRTTTSRAEIAGRIAEIVRERRSRPRRGARSRHRLDADRHLPRADPPASRRRSRLLARRDVQPRRVLPDVAGQPAQLPPVHAGEPLRAREHRPAQRPHPARRPAARRGRGALPRVRARDRRRPAASTSRSSASARPGTSASTSPARAPRSRTRLVVLDTITRRAAAADFFGTENVPAEAITMGVATILEAREIALVATGEHKAAIVQRAVEGDDRPRGRRHLPAAASRTRPSTSTPRPPPS